MDFSEMLYILNTFFEVGHSVDIDTDECVQRNLPVDISLSVQETGGALVADSSLLTLL